MKSKISDKDKKDWEKFLSRKENFVDKDEVLLKKKIAKFRQIDLHGYSLEEANTEIKKLIEHSYENGLNKLIVITGKGLHSDNEKNPFVSKELGILKYSVPEYIRNSPELMNLINEIKDASIKDGGSGAFYIYLKKKL